MVWHARLSHRSCIGIGSIESLVSLFPDDVGETGRTLHRAIGPLVSLFPEDADGKLLTIPSSFPGNRETDDTNACDRQLCCRIGKAARLSR